MTDWKSHASYLADALRELKDDHDRWLAEGFIAAVTGTRTATARSKAALVLDNYETAASAPAPAMQADGVREKYRAVTLEDATMARRKYVRHMCDFSLDHNEAMQLALQSIGAVVPQEPPK